MQEWLKNAFAVNGAAGEWSADEIATLDELARQVVDRRLTTAAIAFLEMSRPLNFLGAQALHFFAPMISAVTNSPRHRPVASLLERRDAIDRLIRRIEELQAQANAAAKQNPTNGPTSGAKS
jgi:hypothetical protein